MRKSTRRPTAPRGIFCRASATPPANLSNFSNPAPPTPPTCPPCSHTYCSAPVQSARQRHVAPLAARAELDQAQGRAVGAMTSALVGELLHVPTVQLAQNPDAAQRVREVFGID